MKLKKDITMDKITCLTTVKTDKTKKIHMILKQNFFDILPTMRKPFGYNISPNFNAGWFGR